MSVEVQALIAETAILLDDLSVEKQSVVSQALTQFVNLQSSIVMFF